jgi:ATP-dependent exoDNAse (exonuclease V) alpha subunit
METSKAAKKSDTIETANIGDVDMLLSSVAAVDKEERVNSASHKVTVRLLDSDKEIILDKAAQINNTILGYALTVHKSQGSEWRRVFVVFHKEHNRMLQRELLYTAVTRAKEELIIICERDSFIQGIQSQRIQGNTLAEKAEFWKGRYKKEEMK